MDNQSHHTSWNHRGASTSALLVVALTLAICSVADVSAATIIMDLEAGTPSAQVTNKKSLTRLMGRLTDAAHQFSQRCGVGAIKLHSPSLALTHGPVTSLAIVTNDPAPGFVTDRFRVTSPNTIRNHLTDLPPPHAAMGV